MVHIRGKVFTPDDIRRLCRVAEAAGKERNPDAQLRVTLTGTEDDRYEGTLASLIEPDDYLVNRRILEVEAAFTLTHSRIDIDLVQGKGVWSWESSSFTVQGNDPTWVNGTIRRIEQELERARKQVIWPMWSRVLGIVMVTAAIWAGMWLLTDAIYNAEPERPTLADRVDSDAYYPVTAATLRMFAIAAGWIPGLALIGWLVGQWPNVELQTGQDFMSKERRTRRAMLAVAGAIVLPFVINYAAGLALP